MEEKAEEVGKEVVGERGDVKEVEEEGEERRVWWYSYFKFDFKILMI